MEIALLVVGIVVGAIAGPQIYNIAMGQIRMRRLGVRYGLPPQVILDQYISFMKMASITGHPPTLRSFEMALREQLFSFNESVKLIEPLYCKGLDPLNPYQGS